MFLTELNMVALLKLGHGGEIHPVSSQALVRLFGRVHFTVLHAVASLTNKPEPWVFNR